jgi:pimeloyl-ACP methyl ester carboxylesterase
MQQSSPEPHSTRQPAARARSPRRPGWIRRHPVLVGLATVGGLLTAATLLNRQLAETAEADNPPLGQFLDVGGVRLHYVERGTGPVLVLLHGNGSMVEDFLSSGLVELAAARHRVIVFDRPGFGHSNRPRDTEWTADAQAVVIHAALGQLGVTRAVVLGHSWGASVAVALGLRHPQMVGGLILASGYYFPTPRVDLLLPSTPAIPGLGDVLSQSVAPLASRAMWPGLMQKMFGPADVPPKFDAFPKEMALRPSQVRAEADETAMMVPVAASASGKYGRLRMPVAVVAGAGDRLIDPEAQSARLHRDIPQSSYHCIEGSGHMVHQTDTVAVMAAVDKIAAQAA